MSCDECQRRRMTATASTPAIPTQKKIAALPMSSLRSGRNRQLSVGAPHDLPGADNDMYVRVTLSLKTVCLGYSGRMVAT